MASKKFKRLFAIRFLSYFAILVGALTILFEFGPLLVSEFDYQRDQLFQVHHVIAQSVTTSTGQQVQTVSGSGGGGSSSFGDTSGTDVAITPVSTDYGIIIEKINANSRVIQNVDPGNEAEYTAALAKGVAEASGSTPPGQPGNLYIFSHSTDAPWNVIRYNAVFYLLRDLDAGDRVIIFYQGRRYDYIVYDKHIIDPTDLTYLNNRYDKPVLTLQTCDPPGTLSHRLIVRARLESS
jgi:LPXTG-site transpeptidase (sortase) family protein